MIVGTEVGRIEYCWGMKRINHRLFKMRPYSFRRNSGVKGAELVSAECEINRPNIERQAYALEARMKNEGMCNRGLISSID